MSRCRVTMFAVCALLNLPGALAAQPRASERGTVSQIVNGTTITFDFARPVARGRTNLFGGVVHWVEMWTPGANWATTMEVDGTVEVNGHPLPAGKYSVWMQPQPDEWTVFFNRVARLYHDSPVPDDQVQLSFTVTPAEGAHMEALAWYFPVVGPRDATVRMHWGSTFVPLVIETRAFLPAAVPADRLASYIGNYRVSGRDPTTGEPLEFMLQVLEEDGQISGRWGRAPIELVPAGENEFYRGVVRGGEWFDVGDEMTIFMIMDQERAVAVELRWEGEPFARGERVR